MRRMILTVAVLGISTVIFAQTDSSAVYFQKGIEEKGKGRRQESLKQFEKAYNYKSSAKQLVSEFAAPYLGLRRYGQAKEKFLQLEKLGDKSDSTYRQLMLLSFNTRQWDETIKYASLLKKT